MSQRLRIGELAEQAGVTQRTIRYYESMELIPPGEREGSGYHYYSEEMLARLRKIDQLKKLGLSLEEIRDVIDLYFTDPSGIQPKQKVLAILRKHLAETNKKMGELSKFQAELQFNIERFERFLEQAQDK